MTTGSPWDFFLVYFSPQLPENLTLVISFWTKSLGILLPGIMMSYPQDVFEIQTCENKFCSFLMPGCKL